MTQEEKQLLLKDLCARLPYNVVIRCTDNDTDYRCFLTTNILNELLYNIEYYDYKPYLRPLSSMTGEEKEILERLSNCFVQTRVLERGRNGKIKKQISYLDNEIEEIDLFGDNDTRYNHISQQNFIDTTDFFNSRHIDYRGLIEKGLALEAPEGMYKTV